MGAYSNHRASQGFGTQQSKARLHGDEGVGIPKLLLELDQSLGSAASRLAQALLSLIEERFPWVRTLGNMGKTSVGSHFGLCNNTEHGASKLGPSPCRRLYLNFTLTVSSSVPRFQHAISLLTLEDTNKKQKLKQNNK